MPKKIKRPRKVNTADVLALDDEDNVQDAQAINHAALSEVQSLESPSPTAAKKKFLPMTLTPNFDAIPQMLKDLPRWLCWQLQPREDKPAKVPMTPKRGKLVNAAVNKPENWLTFDEAVSWYNRGLCSGVGFALTNTPPQVCCTDIDHCISDDGSLSDVARDGLSICQNSCTGKSQSGTGIHVWYVDDDAVESGRKNTVVEVYSDARYIVVTGVRVQPSTTELLTVNGACRKVIEKYIGERSEKLFEKKPARTDNSTDISQNSAEGTSEPTDAERFGKCKNVFTFKPSTLTDEDRRLVEYFQSDQCRNDDSNLFALFNGDVDGYFKNTGDTRDDSVADINLMLKLFSYVGGSGDDVEIGQRVLKLFGQSALTRREKWQREDYQIRTLNAAFDAWNKNGRKLNGSVTGDAKIDEWQRKNGAIDPSILSDVRDAQKMLLELSPEKITALFLRSTDLMRQVALCKYYSFAVDAVEKFFDVVSTAKSDADAQIKSVKKKGGGFTCEPSDEVKAIARITLSELKADIAKQVTKIRRQHKKFFEDFTRKKIRAQQQADIEEYLAGNPTTKKFIPDCPVDLIVGKGIYFDEKDGVGLRTFSDRGEVTRQAALKPVIITRKLCESNTGEVVYEIAIKTGGKWHTHTVDGRALQSARGIDVLGGFGLPIEDPTALQKFFARLIADNDETLSTLTVYNNPGWHGDKFIYPTPTDAGEYCVKRSGIDYSSIFTTKGDAAVWLNKLFSVVNDKKQGTLKRIVIGACALAPMLEVIEIPNPQFNFWGPSNYAKTPLFKLGLSLYGDPTEGKLMRTWNSSANNMLTMAVGFNGLPLFVDEGETMSKKMQADLPEFIYNFSIGIIGQRNKRNGDVRPTEIFHSTRLSTAEHPLHDVTDKRGSFKRLIDIHVSKPIFSDDEARALHIFCKKHFGHYGRQWTRYVETHREEIFNDFETFCRHFATHGFTRGGLRVDFKSVDATNARAVIGCVVAFKHLCHCLEFVDCFSFDDLRDDAATVLAELPTVDDMSDASRSIELLKSWVAENPKRFKTPKEINGAPIEDEYCDAQSYASAVGLKRVDGSIAFYTNAFKNIVFKEIGLPSYGKFLSDLYDAGALDCKDRRTKRKTIRDGKDIPHCYVIKSDVFSGDNESESGTL